MQAGLKTEKTFPSTLTLLHLVVLLILNMHVGLGFLLLFFVLVFFGGGEWVGKVL